MSATKPTSPAPAGGGKKPAVEPKAPAAAVTIHERRAKAAVPFVPLSAKKGHRVWWQRRIVCFWIILLITGVILALLVSRWWSILAILGGGGLIAFADGFVRCGTNRFVLLLENGVVHEVLIDGGHWISSFLGGMQIEEVETKERPTTLLIEGKTIDEEQVACTLLCPSQPDPTIPDEHGHMPQYVHLQHGGGLDASLARVDASNTEFGARLFKGATKPEIEEGAFLWARLCEANGRLSLPMLDELGLDIEAEPVDLWAWAHDRGNFNRLCTMLASHEADVEPSEPERLAGIRQNGGWSAGTPQFSPAVTEAGEAAAEVAGDVARVNAMEVVRRSIVAQASIEADASGLTGAARATYIGRQVAASLAAAGVVDATAVVGGELPEMAVDESIVEEARGSTGPRTTRGRRGRRRGT